MGSTKEIFKEAIPFTYILDGVINGVKFVIEGKGIGNAATGTLNGKFWCTKGRSPMSWKALSPYLGYGFTCYCLYPVGIVNFFQETMPSGYSEDRVCRDEDGGVVKCHREISLNNGVIVSKGSFVGEKFPEDSPILTQNLKDPVPLMAVSTPFKDGIRTMCNYVFPTEPGKYYSGVLTTVNRPLGSYSGTAQPDVHYQRAEFTQFKDTDGNKDGDYRDCVVQKEFIEALHCRVIDDMN